MTNDEAKKILMYYRPGTDDRLDPEFTEALRIARPETGAPRDAAMARWFNDHCADYLKVRRAFLEIPVPAGLKGQILGERKAATDSLLHRRIMVVAAALMAVALVLGLLCLSFSAAHTQRSLEAYRTRMVRNALRLYGMDLQTPDLNLIQAHLRQKNWPSDYTLPETLMAAPAVGCDALIWQGKRVSMICFRTGRPMEPGQKADLWLFVTDKQTLTTATNPGKLELAKVNKLITATWSRGSTVYLLAVQGAPDLLQRYLR